LVLFSPKKARFFDSEGEKNVEKHYLKLKKKAMGTVT